MIEPGSQLVAVAGRLIGGRVTHLARLANRRIGRCDSIPPMTGGSNIAALKTALTAAEARAANAEAQPAFLKLTIEKLRREMFGWCAERKQQLVDQLELQLDKLEASATEVKGVTRRQPARKAFLAHLPRERAVVVPPTSCACCASEKPSKIGEDVTETLEVVPRRWKVIQTVREKFTCRHYEKISQPPAPFHPTPRGWAGSNLLATIVFEKYGQHQPLNWQRDRCAREGVDLSLSTLADQVGACTVALRPLHDMIAAHVLAAEQLFDVRTRRRSASQRIPVIGFQGVKVLRLTTGRSAMRR